MLITETRLHQEALCRQVCWNSSICIDKKVSSQMLEYCCSQKERAGTGDSSRDP